MASSDGHSIDEEIDRLMDGAYELHPWFEPGVTATEPIALDAPIEHDGTNRAYAMRIDGDAPIPVAITVDESHLSLLTEDGLELTAELDAVTVSVQSWTKLRLNAGGETITLEFLEKRTRSGSRATKAAAAAIMLAGAIGPGGAVGVRAGSRVMLTLSWLRMPMLYRHLERRAATFEPMPWSHPQRVLYSTIGALSTLFFCAAALLFIVIAGTLPVLFAGATIGPILRDGLSITEVPVVALETILFVAIAALLQTALVRAGALDIPFLNRCLAGRASPAERADMATFTLGNRRTGSVLMYGFGNLHRRWVLPGVVPAMVAAVSLDVHRQGEVGIADGGWGLAYYGAIAIAVGLGIAYAARHLVVSPSTHLNALSWIRNHRIRSNTLLEWDNARFVLIVAAVATAAMVIVPPLFAP